MDKDAKQTGGNSEGEARARINSLRLMAERATNALGLEETDKYDVLAVISGGPKKIVPDQESPYSLSNLGIEAQLASGMLRVDNAAKKLVTNLGLPEDTRYEVLKTLFYSPSKNDESSTEYVEETKEEAVSRMVKDTKEKMAKLGLQQDKEKELMSILYGEVGVNLVEQYRKDHPEK